MLHAMGMVLRKKHGQGSSKYVLEPGWWAGLLTDGLGGAIFAAVTPPLVRTLREKMPQVDPCGAPCRDQFENSGLKFKEHQLGAV